MQRDLPHLTFSPPTCLATPHPLKKKGVVWQMQRLTCRTSAELVVWQVWQPMFNRAFPRDSRPLGYKTNPCR